MLSELGFTNVYVVPEQELPNGYFSTVEFPNPEDARAFEMALKLAEKVDADVVLATDPDAVEKVNNFIAGLGFQDSKEAFYKEVDYLNIHYDKASIISFVSQKKRLSSGHFGGTGPFAQTFAPSRITSPFCATYFLCTLHQ